MATICCRNVNNLTDKGCHLTNLYSLLVTVSDYEYIFTDGGVLTILIEQYKDDVDDMITQLHVGDCTSHVLQCRCSTVTHNIVLSSRAV